MINNTDISNAMTIKLDQALAKLPRMPQFISGVRRAPKRNFTLTPQETELSLKNALRYVPVKWHQRLAGEFLEELITRGRIYGYR